jgi:putative intracellular protease/amidase
MDITCLLFDGLTALDVVGPYEVLQRLPEANVQFVAREAGPVRTDTGFLALVADAAWSDVKSSEVLVVPGGFATRALEEDAELLAWIRAIDATTTWTTSVCTGAMLLAAAGLLQGKEATTHWASLDRLAEYGAIPARERVVTQGKIMTAAGDDFAQGIQLGIEYDPQPPFDAGSVHKAPENVIEMMTRFYAGRGVAR